MFTRRPTKTKLMYAIEEKFGRPIDELLGEMYFVKGMSLNKIGEALGIKNKQPGSMISRWMLQLGIPTRIMLTQEEFNNMRGGKKQVG